MSTPDGGYVLDPFGGSGTTLLVSMRERFNCDLIETDLGYCKRIAEENNLKGRRTKPKTWTREMTGEIEDLPLLGGPQDKVPRS
jgi:DNA modification methylase